MTSTIQSSLNFAIRKTNSQTNECDTRLSNFGYKLDDDNPRIRSHAVLTTPTAQKCKASTSITTTCSPPKKFCDSIGNRQSDVPVVSPTTGKTTTKNRSSSRKVERNVDYRDENTPEKKSRTPPGKSGDRKSACVQLFKQDVTAYQELKSVLTTSCTAAALPCRETEMEVITQFLEDHLVKEKPGSLYVSGAPGTGKTACLNQILQAVKRSGHKTLFINCTTLDSVHSVYKRIWTELNGKHSTFDTRSVGTIQKDLRCQMTGRDGMILLVLDEIDYLDSKNQQILYTIFEWPALDRSNLVLIGIANALDLTDRVLPRLQGHSHCRPRLLHFPPYSRDQLLTILKDRLKHVSSHSRSIIQPAALQFCARKVASVSGDIRKALDICRRAVEVVESNVRKQKILQPQLQNDGDANYVRKSNLMDSKATSGVELNTIAKIVNDVYGSTLTGDTESGNNSLPLHQKVLLCTLLLIVRKGKSKEVTIGKFHEVYCRVCRKRHISHLDQSDFLNICTLVESRGLISIKTNKISRLSKVTLKVDENEVEFALQDKALLSSIFEDGATLTS